MSEGPQTLLEALELTDPAARTTEDIVVGRPMRTPHKRVFGGQVLAQALLAAGRTVPEGRELHSMHGYFLRAGSIEENLTFGIDRLYDGRSFSTRRTQVFQSARPIFSMISSFQQPDPGLDHQADIDLRRIPAPEDLMSLQERYAGITHARAAWVLQRPVDIRHTSTPIFVEVEGERRAEQCVWVRVTEPLGEDPTLHKAALAFASDYIILEPLMRRHGLPWATPGMSMASLDHAMWFHRDARADDWLLFVTESPSAQSSRGLATGRVYDRDGRLVASLAQEGMVRLPEELLEAIEGGDDAGSGTS